MFDSVPLSHKIHILGHLLEVDASATLQKNKQIAFNSYIILFILNKHESVSQQFLADKIKISTAAISKRIKILLDKKLITTKINDSNRREHVISLTTSGKKVLDESTELLEQHFAHKIKEFKNKEEFELLLNQLLEILYRDAHDSRHC